MSSDSDNLSTLLTRGIHNAIAAYNVAAKTKNKLTQPKNTDQYSPTSMARGELIINTIKEVANNLTNLDGLTDDEKKLKIWNISQGGIIKTTVDNIQAIQSLSPAALKNTSNMMKNVFTRPPPPAVDPSQSPAAPAAPAAKPWWKGGRRGTRNKNKKRPRKRTIKNKKGRRS